MLIGRELGWTPKTAEVVYAQTLLTGSQPQAGNVGQGQAASPRRRDPPPGLAGGILDRPAGVL